MGEVVRVCGEGVWWEKWCGCVVGEVMRVCGGEIVRVCGGLLATNNNMKSKDNSV